MELFKVFFKGTVHPKMKPVWI